MSNITLRAKRSAEVILAGGSPLEVVSVLVTELDLHLTRHMKSNLDLRSGGGGGRGQRDTGGCGGVGGFTLGAAARSNLSQAGGALLFDRWGRPHI